MFFFHDEITYFDVSFLLYVTSILMQSALDMKSTKNRRIASYIMHVGVTANDH